MTTPRITSLTGCLGKDRQVAYTRERTWTVQFVNEITETEDERDVTIPAREFLVLSLAQRLPDKRTRWHRLVIWPDKLKSGLDYTHLARTGDRVTVTGYHETFKTDPSSGPVREIAQFIVETLYWERLKVRPSIADPMQLWTPPRKRGVRQPRA